MKLRSKLLVSYILLISSAFMVFYLISVPLVRNYIKNNIRDGLVQEATLIRNRLQTAVQEVDDRESYFKTLTSERIAVDRLGLSSSIGILYYSRSAGSFYEGTYSVNLPEYSEKILIEKMEANDTEPMTTSIDGKSYLATYFMAPGSKLANQRLVILVYTPLDAVVTFTRGFTRIIILVFAAVMVIAVIISLIFAGRINKPIKKLKSQAMDLKARNFESKTEIKTGDELEDLSNAMNAAAVELAGHTKLQRDFLDNVSHELKTPLMSIQGYAEGIRDGIFPPDDRTLEIITDESIRLKNLVSEISYLSKLESMPGFYNISDVAVDEVISRAVETVSGLPRARKIKISLLNLLPSVIKGDGEKLLQLMLNILSNCIRHASSTVFLDTELHDNEYVITIKDDGTGFEPGEEEKIFRRFYKGRGGSTGLGLSIAMAIANYHGGTIHAWNASPGGAVFEITLAV